MKAHKEYKPPPKTNTRAIERLIVSIASLIAVLTHILFVTFFNLFVFHLQVDIVSPLLMNASLLIVLTTEYSD